MFSENKTDVIPRSKDHDSAEEDGCVFQGYLGRLPPANALRDPSHLSRSLICPMRRFHSCLEIMNIPKWVVDCELSDEGLTVWSL